MMSTIKKHALTTATGVFAFLVIQFVSSFATKASVDSLAFETRTSVERLDAKLERINLKLCIMNKLTCDR